MGTYLSTPVLEKHTEKGSDLHDSIPVRWAVVDMQGWRKSMEDAHVARTDVSLPRCRNTLIPSTEEDAHVARTDLSLRRCRSTLTPKPEDGASSSSNSSTSASALSLSPSSKRAKVFAVFDGHGGAEAARFCQTRLVSVLTSCAHWNGESESATPTPAENDNDINGDDNQHVAHCIGQALIETFHALDRLIDDPSSREEIERLRSEVPPPYVAGKEITRVEERSVDVHEAGGEDPQKRCCTILHPCDHEVADADADADDNDTAKLHLLDSGDDESEDSEENTVPDDGKSIKEWDVPEGAEAVDEDEVFEDSLSEETEDPDPDALALGNKHSDGVIHDDSDQEEEENTGKDRETEDVTTLSNEGKGTMVISANDAVAMFQKMLHINGPPYANSDASETDNAHYDKQEESTKGVTTKFQEESADGDGSDRGGGVVNGVVVPTKAQLLNPPTGNVELSASVPTRIQNGRKVCNLPDHPIHAGCTSVVAVIVGHTLVVANAGDSRAVLCRAGGLMEPLSFDHKPNQNREINRITNAGGFVNQFGRVNGNLNLSRSIGDLKYKQVPGISPAEQIITAEPDILTTSLRVGDEFMILGCDGIWDCLSNEECVKYVRDRIDTKQPHEIGMEMLDDIVSADPRASQGIGGDNMTIMIIDLLPQSRAYKDG